MLRGCKAKPELDPEKHAELEKLEVEKEEDGKQNDREAAVDGVVGNISLFFISYFLLFVLY